MGGMDMVIDITALLYWRKGTVIASQFFNLHFFSLSKNGNNGKSLL
jgi:hypothetical protein